MTILRGALAISIGFILTCSALCGEGKTVIHSAHFEGNRSLTDREISGAILSVSGARWSRNQLSRDLESILQLYHENGFYLATVQADSLSFTGDSSTVDIAVVITEGDQVRIGGIHLEGNRVLPAEEIFKHFETHAGGFLDARVLERDIHATLTVYENIGYPFATVEVNRISLSAGTSGTLQIDLAIHEGGLIDIDEISIRGNNETKDNVIIRETRIHSSEPFNAEKVMKIKRKLNRLNIFSRVDEPELYVTGRGGGGLLIRVQEGSTNTFDGVAGYVPGSAAGEQGIFAGMVNVSMRNLFGTARKLNVRWQRDDPATQEIAIQYVEPWVLNYPANLSGAFSQRQQDTSYVRRSFEARADLLLTESISIGGTFGRDEIIPSTTAVAPGVARSRSIATGIDFLYDTRDDIVSPTSGVFYRTNYQIGNKKIFSPATTSPAGDEQSTLQRIGLDAVLYVRTLNQQVVAAGVHARQQTNDHVELGDLYRFGGTNTLRGYRENQFLGSRIAWTNAEYRFLLARRSYFFGLFDTGYYYLPADDLKGTPSSQHFKYGYGVGIRLESSLGNIGVDFALGEGDSFTQGKIHVGLVNEF